MTPAGGLPVVEPDPRTARTSAGVAALPVPAGPLIGRDGELAAVLEMLDGSPLVTLTGSGGVGKTRLALAAAHASAHRYRDGTAWVDLAPLADPSLLALTLMAGLGVRGDPAAEPLDSLQTALARRQTLIVLDNAEGVAAAAAQIATLLLSRCPGIALLVTSRERLGIRTESVRVVPSLEVPDMAALPAVAELAGIASVRLLLERVRRFLPEFELTQAQAPAAARICAGLDGIPLAIEFAAARVRTLSLDAIAARLDRTLGAFGESLAPRPRHMTLRAAMDWSHELLEDPERTLLRRVAIFAGSWTLEAAERVCAGEGLAAGDVATLLARLVDRSLVVAEGTGSTVTRNRLLETTRQYARGKLEAAEEATVVARRHADYFLALAERAAPQLYGSAQLEWHRRLTAEYNDLRAVLERSARDGRLAPDGLRMTAALTYWLYFFASRIGEAGAWVELAAGTPQPDGRAEATAWGRSMLWAGWLAWHRGDLASARARLDAALDVLDAQDDRHAGLAVLIRGIVAVLEGDTAAMASDWAQARRRFDALNDRWGLAMVSACEGEAAQLFGDVAAGLAGAEAAAAGLRDIGDDTMLVQVGINLTKVALAAGDAERAETLIDDALERALRLENAWNVCYCVACAGQAALLRGDGLRAAQLLAAAHALFERIGSDPQPHDREAFEAAAAAARAALGERRYTAAREDGRRLGFDEAVALVRSSSAGSAATSGGSPLSPREMEVAELIAQGRTNRQIADALTISHHTAERHVENILAKLGLSSRVQVATWLATTAPEDGGSPFAARR